MRHVLLVGQVTFERMGDRFRGSGASDYGISPWTLAVVVAIAGGLLCYFIRRLRAARREEACYHPGRLFRELCRAHQLTRADCRLLKKVARRLHDEHPGALFLDPTALPQALNMPRLLDQHEGLRRLEQQLFPDDGSHQEGASSEAEDPPRSRPCSAPGS